MTDDGTEPDAHELATGGGSGPGISTGRRVAIGVLGGFIVAAIVAIAVISLTGDDDDAPLAAGELGPVHELAYTTFDGEAGTLGAFAGQPIVLNFFASWCPPCIAEMPAIERVHQDHADDIAFVGLAVNDRPEDALEIVAETGVTYFVAQDSENLVVELEGRVMPTTVFVSADGRVVHRQLGELTEGQLRELIEEELGG